MKSLSTFFYNKSSLLVSIILTIISFGFLFFVMVDKTKCYELTEGVNTTLGTSFTYSMDTVLAFFSARTTEMLECFVNLHKIYDNIFAITYGLMNVAWISYVFKPYSNKLGWLNLVPFLQTILDWLENFQLNKLANQFMETGAIESTSVTIASMYTSTKWIIYSLFFLALLPGIIMRIRRWMKYNVNNLP